MEWLQLALVVVVAYALGAIPNGLLVSRRMGRDLREHGSGKTGATNALRVLGRGPAVVVLALDAAKGALAVALARILLWPDATWLGTALGVAALAAVVGHIWSVWIRLFFGAWGGGRGVATCIGVMLVVHPLVALAGLVIGVTVIALTRYVSLASILAVTAGLGLTVLLVTLDQIPAAFLPWAVVLGALVVAVHYDNIDRLLRGTERKIGSKV